MHDPMNAALGEIMSSIGVRSPEDAIEQTDLGPQVAELVDCGVPRDVAVRVCLVSYGKALKATGSVLLRGVSALFGPKAG